MAGKKKITKKKGTRGTGKSVEPRNADELALDNAEVREAIAAHCKVLSSKAAERQVINADISASRNGLVSRGLNRKALTVVEACAKMEPQHADGFAQTLIMGLKAIGKPLQQDLFDTPESVEEKVAAAAKVLGAAKEAVGGVSNAGPVTDNVSPLHPPH